LPSRRPSLGVLGFLLAIATLIGNCYIAGKLALADTTTREDTLSSVREAIRSEPDNASYRLLLAAHLEAEGHREESLRSLERAAALNPRDSRVWSALAVAAETAGNIPRAASYRLAAVRVDRGFDPQWGLARFCYRRGSSESFWRQARGAAEMADENDLDEVFRYCWIAALAESSGGNILFERVVPRTQQARARYLSFLLDGNHLSEAAPVADWLLRNGGTAELQSVLGYCDRLIRQGQAEDAVALWDGLIVRGLIESNSLAPDQGVSLTNGTFHPPFRGCCFGWRLAAYPGIVWQQDALPSGLLISLSGQQPEDMEFLTQVAPVLPARGYEFDCDSQTESLGALAVLRWRVRDAVSGADLAPGSPQLALKDWTTAKIPFHTSGASRLVKLTLTYHRLVRPTMKEGSLRLKNASLKLEAAR
jgi:tetratricopeptide (TPR) repeat protein